MLATVHRSSSAQGKAGSSSCRARFVLFLPYLLFLVVSLVTTVFSSTSLATIDSSSPADRVRQAVSSAAGADDLVVMFETAEYAAETGALFKKLVLFGLFFVDKDLFC